MCEQRRIGNLYAARCLLLPQSNAENQRSCYGNGKQAIIWIAKKATKKRVAKMTTLRNAITWALLSGLLLTTPAIGGQGWYLVYIREGRVTSQIRAYDTARDCEKVRMMTLDICKEIGRKDCAQIEKESFCLASDDPRLKANKK